MTVGVDTAMQAMLAGFLLAALLIWGHVSNC